jgi:predicted transcriptional regulator
MVITPEELKKRRNELGLSQKKMSDALGVSQSILSKFEAKKHYPGYHALKKIEEHLQSIKEENPSTVENFMVRGVMSFKSTDKVKEVSRAFKQKSYSQAPVIEDGMVLGLITARGLLDADPAESISDKLEPEPPVISKETPLAVGKSLLKEFPMLLINDKGKIIGILAREDVL